MKLICYFDIKAAHNPYFKEIYDNIFVKLRKTFPQHEFTHVQPPGTDGGDWCMSCPGGRSNFQIINPENNKTILMSFWDRGMEPLEFKEELGWGNYDIKQYIGGLGMHTSSHDILKKYGIEHIPFQYPLGVPDSDKFIKEFREEYDPKKKIRKAIFIGMKHNIRKEFFPLMENHPLIELYDSGYGGRDFYKKVSEYALSLSFNGSGEYTLRDLESMGMGIPVIRSETLTQYFNPLVPNYHYIKGSEACKEGRDSYRDIGAKAISEQFINKIEQIINDDKALMLFSNAGLAYYDSYVNTEYIINLFFKLLKLDKLK